MRLLRPSLTDLFLLFTLYWQCVATPGSWQALLKDGDTGLHLRTGDWILANHRVPVVDIFSYTRPGAPWYAFQWGSAVLYSFLNTTWGIKAIAFLAGVTIALWVTVLMQTMLAIRVNGLLAPLLAFAAANAASIHYLARPHLFTMLFLAISVWLIETDRQAPSNRVWLLVPLAAIWVNVHSAFIVLPMYLIAVAAGLYLEKGPFKRYLTLAAASIFATLANPYGIKLHLHILSFLSGPVATRLVDEYQSPQFRGEPLYWFLALLFGALLMAGVMLFDRRFADPFAILLFGAMALVSARNIPLFLTVALPLAARELTKRWRDSGALKDFYSYGSAFSDRCPGFSIWSCAAIAAIALLTAKTSWPTDLDPKLFPVALMERNDALLQSGRVLTTDQWSDELIYRYKGRQLVFIDGRSDFYPAAVVADYTTMFNGAPAWRMLLDQYKIDTVIAPSGGPLNSLLVDDKEWSAQDRDANAVIFARNR